MDEYPDYTIGRNPHRHICAFADTVGLRSGDASLRITIFPNSVAGRIRMHNTARWVPIPVAGVTNGIGVIPLIVILLGSMIGGVTALAVAQEKVPTIQHVERVPDTANPELLYWFISPNEMKDRAYVRDLDLIAANGTFNFMFLTEREGADFYDYPTMHPIFKDLVARARAKGIKVGLQLWPNEKHVPDDQTQGIVVEKELTVDATGQADYAADSKGIRSSGSNPSVYHNECVRSELLHAYAFKGKTDGEYTPGSVIDITGSTHGTSHTPCSVALHIRVSARLAGYKAYVMTVHYHRYPDMFSKFMEDSFASAMRAYKDVGFDGAALDEFKYIVLGKARDEQFRERLYTKNMAVFYKKRTGQDLIRTLFDMRYSPRGDPRVRVRAINNYFDMLRLGPLQVEQKFYQATSEIFGPQAFHGIHNTFHNHLTSDEIWSTGINWWEVPRDYGQSDEITPYTTQLGIGLNHPKSVEYRQHYGSVHSFLEDGINDARFNVRVHYHALNDEHGWGTDMRDPEMLKGVSAVEDKVRLLNFFDAPRPAMNVLYLFGYPALANWFPIQHQRNEWDINGSLKAEEKAVQGWNAGYRGAFASSNLIQEGKITTDGHGGILYGGHRFTALVFIGPEYSKPSTLTLLERFAADGGKLMLDGTATEDFAGNSVRTQFNKLAQRAVATSFDVDSMSKLGVPKLAIDEGAVYDDGSVVLADLDSLLNKQPKPFSVTVAGHIFSGEYIGLLAIKSDAEGDVVKLAAGSLHELKCDGKAVVTLSTPSDVVLLWGKRGTYSGIVRGDATVTIH